MAPTPTPYFLTPCSLLKPAPSPRRGIIYPTLPDSES